MLETGAIVSARQTGELRIVLFAEKVLPVGRDLPTPTAELHTVLALLETLMAQCILIMTHHKHKEALAFAQIRISVNLASYR